ncbi:hypothetical protein ACLK2E_06640 [Escherichia coli]
MQAFSGNPLQRRPAVRRIPLLAAIDGRGGQAAGLDSRASVAAATFAARSLEAALTYSGNSARRSADCAPYDFSDRNGPTTFFIVPRHSSTGFAGRWLMRHTARI